MLKREALRAAKENLAAAGLLSDDPQVRGLHAQIERSWRRSVSLGVSPAQSELTDSGSLPRDDRLLTAAAPVLRKLAEDVADLAVAVVLSDARGRIIERVALNARQRARLDHLGVVVGADFAERAVGTNGLGSALEERAPLFVRGAEHFIDALEEVACAGVPIFDPGTRRVRGSLSLTCREKVANRLMLTLTHAAVRDIEQRLTDDRTQLLQDIASAFAEATSRSAGAIALLTPSTVLANTAGLSFVSPANHVTLWDRLVSHGVEQATVLEVELAEGPVGLRAQRVRVADEQLAFQVTFSAVRPRRRERTGPRWHPLWSVHDALRAAAAASPVVAILGEPGTGRSCAARRVLQHAADGVRELDFGQRTGADGVREVDLDRRTGTDVACWQQVVIASAGDGPPALLRHVEQLTAKEVGELGELLCSLGGRSAGPPRLVLTGDRDRAAPGLVALLERHAGVVELPALRDMPETIPSLVQSIIDERPPDERCRITATALQVLSTRSWRGNFPELRRVVLGLLTGRSGRPITAGDLPAADSGLGRRLSAIERSERATIVQALREADGNRAAAARALGIGRTTLYRKLRSLRIDDEELTG